MAGLRAKRAALQSGADAESAVARLLQANGWEVLERNWRGGNGELDLIVRDRARLRLVEVKLRQPDDPVGLEAIDGRKLKKLSRAGEAWLQDYDGPVDEVCWLVALVHPGAEGYRIQLFDDPV
ncbi:MAG: YraN family protein [Myxococcota bacterium]|nr:YraN family protein [Myxococcota bacterium]